ncbi:hypothetical protein ACH5RR_025550 [Cinchona calisaya]|uniref:Uncharacterized protein n=1 Tax=Cinchona calisaya TaxID=153742 RepID=A0ABD2YZZ0_9GENT
MDDGCWEYHSSKALDILEHVFDELGKIPNKVVSLLHELLYLDFLQDDLDMRPTPRKFRQSMFAGRPLIGGASSSKVKVNMSRTTGPFIIVSSGLPQVQRTRGQHFEPKNSSEEDLSKHEHEPSSAEVVVPPLSKRKKRKGSPKHEEKRKVKGDINDSAYVYSQLPHSSVDLELMRK